MSVFVSALKYFIIVLVISFIAGWIFLGTVRCVSGYVGIDRRSVTVFVVCHKLDW